MIGDNFPSRWPIFCHWEDVRTVIAYQGDLKTSVRSHTPSCLEATGRPGDQANIFVARDRGDVVDSISHKFNVDLLVCKLRSRDIKPNRVRIRRPGKELQKVPSK
jgi:hypothetical protein